VCFIVTDKGEYAEVGRHRAL